MCFLFLIDMNFNIFQVTGLPVCRPKDMLVSSRSELKTGFDQCGDDCHKTDYKVSTSSSALEYNVIGEYIMSLIGPDNDTDTEHMESLT